MVLFHAYMDRTPSQAVLLAGKRITQALPPIYVPRKGFKYGLTAAYSAFNINPGIHVFTHAKNGMLLIGASGSGSIADLGIDTPPTHMYSYSCGLPPACLRSCSLMTGLNSCFSPRCISIHPSQVRGFRMVVMVLAEELEAAQ